MRVALYNAQQAHTAITALYQQIKPFLFAGKQYVIEVKEKTRSTAQNAKMWAMLGEVSEQVDWHGQKLTPDEWKDVFTAALKKQRAVPGIDGGFVILGQRTSKMSIRDMAELIELMQAFGAQHDVRFTAPERLEAA